MIGGEAQAGRTAWTTNSPHTSRVCGESWSNGERVGQPPNGSNRTTVTLMSAPLGAV